MKFARLKSVLYGNKEYEAVESKVMIFDSTALLTITC